MRYFIGYLIQGEAAKWYYSIAKDISDKFGTWPIYEKIPPHITLFRPFEADNLIEIQDLIKDLISSTMVRNENIKINDFDYFDDRVIFAKIQTSKILADTILSFKSKLQKIPGMPSDQYKEWRPHLTIINKSNLQTIQAVKRYITTCEKPNFILPFDNITIFSYIGNGSWQVFKRYDVL